MRKEVRDLVRDELPVRLPAFDRHYDQRVSPSGGLEEGAAGRRAGQILVIGERSGHEDAHVSRDFHLLAEQPLDDEGAQLLQIFQQDLGLETRDVGVEQEMSGLVLAPFGSALGWTGESKRKRAEERDQGRN